jgi:hypothetical protein
MEITMRAYGLPKDHDIDFPDKGSQRDYALKSSKGNVKQKCGKYKNFIRNTKNKQETRQLFKGMARMKSKELILQEIKDET